MPSLDLLSILFKTNSNKIVFFAAIFVRYEKIHTEYIYSDTDDCVSTRADRYSYQRHPQAGAQPGEYAGYGYPFSIKVDSKGITDQKSSGRCWLFTGLNVMRAKALARLWFPGFRILGDISFLLGPVGEIQSLPARHHRHCRQTVGRQDGGMAAETSVERRRHIHRSGGHRFQIRPCAKSAMPETNSSENTARMANLISLKLKEYALQLRNLAAEGASLPLWRKRKPPCWALSIACWC